MSAYNSHVDMGMASVLTEDDADQATTPECRPIAHGTEKAIEARIRRARAAMDLAAKAGDVATYRRLYAEYSMVLQARSAEIVHGLDEQHLVAVERAIARSDRCATSPRMLPGVWLGCAAESQTGERGGA